MHTFNSLTRSIKAWRQFTIENKKIKLLIEQNDVVTAKVLMFKHTVREGIDRFERQQANQVLLDVDQKSKERYKAESAMRKKEITGRIFIQDGADNQREDKNTVSNQDKEEQQNQTVDDPSEELIIEEYSETNDREDDTMKESNEHHRDTVTLRRLSLTKLSQVKSILLIRLRN